MRGHNPRQKQSQKSFSCIYNTVAHPRVLANCYTSLCQAISISGVANSLGLMGRRADRNSILGAHPFFLRLVEYGSDKICFGQMAMAILDFTFGRHSIGDHHQDAVNLRQYGDGIIAMQQGGQVKNDNA